MLTADCGTSDHEALACSRTRGVDVIVIDHHQVPDGTVAGLRAHQPAPPRRPLPVQGAGLLRRGLLPGGRAALAPARPGTSAPPRSFRSAPAPRPRGAGDAGRPGAPGRGEPHPGAAAGLRELGARRRPGLRALAEIAELDPGAPIDAQDVCFRLTPRLNAPGRLGEAQQALDLLLAPDEAEARQRALEIDDVNRARQRIQEEVWQAACAEAEAQARRRGHRGGRRGLAPRRGRHRRRQAGRALPPARGGGRLPRRGGAGVRRAPSAAFDLHAALAACARSSRGRTAGTLRRPG